MYTVSISASVNIVINEEKLVALLVYDALRWFAKRCYRRVSTRRVSTRRVVTSSEFPYQLVAAVKVIQFDCNLGVKTDSLRIHCNTTAQLSGRNLCDVTRLAAMEHVRNEYSLLKSRTVTIVVILTAHLLTLSIII